MLWRSPAFESRFQQDLANAAQEFAAALRRSMGFLLSGDEICISYDHKLKKEQHHRIKVIPTLLGWILWPHGGRMNRKLFAGEDAMCFMLAALSAAGASCAPGTARCPERVMDARRGIAAGANPAAMEFGPPGHDMGQSLGHMTGL